MARKKKPPVADDTDFRDFGPSEGPGAAIDLIEGRATLPDTGGAVATLEAPPAVAEEPPPMLRWSVTLNCPTPLAHKTLEVDAPDEHAAKLAYYQANGICDSHHGWDIKKLESNP